MGRKLRVLDFDVECLPGHWIAADYVSKIITAASWKVIGSRGRPTVLTHYDTEAEEIAALLAAEIANSDFVVGHYIRGFDLPLLNGNLLRGGNPPIGQVLAQDTKLDLPKAHGRSLSQENLAAQIGVSKPKVKVSLPDWEAFNTRKPGYKEKGIERVAGDVLQNIEMYERLLDLNWLSAPKVWDGGHEEASYVA